jgi:hypothetical protein
VLPVALLLCVIGLALYAVHAADLMAALVSVSGTTPAAALPVSTEPLPVPGGSVMRIQRARSLFERGRLHESLGELGGVPVGDRLRDEADRLAAAIQRALLSGDAATPPPGGQP